MPIVYEAKIDGSNAVRYFHIPLIRFYLDQANEHATKSKEDHREGLLLASSVIGIMFSAMALEAFANEVSENVIQKAELNDFIHLRKAFKKNKQESSLAAKLRILFERKHNLSLDEEQLNDIEKLVLLRNNLVHYKLSELAGKYIMPPPKHTKLSDGGFMTTLDFTVQPESVEPPFIQQVTGAATASCFNIVLLLINLWGNLSGEPDNVPGLKIIA